MGTFGPISIDFPNSLMGQRWAGFRLRRQDMLSEPNHKRRVDAYGGIGIFNPMLVCAAAAFANR